MKKTVWFSLLFVLSISNLISQNMINDLSDRIVIASEDFENDCPLFTKTGGSFYSGNSSSISRPSSSPFFQDGNYGVGISNGTLTLLSTTIDTREYTSIELKYRVAAFSMNTSNGIDSADYLWTQLKTSASDLVDYITVKGPTANNCYWSYSDGLGIASTAYPYVTTYQPAGTGNRTTDGYSTIKITNIPQDIGLTIKIIARNNDANERWMIDSFELSGIPIPLQNPTIYATTAISHEGFTARWSAVNNATDYLLQVSDNEGFNDISQEFFTGSTTIARVTNLSPDTNYYYRLKAINAISSSDFVTAPLIQTGITNQGSGSGTSINGYANIPISGLPGDNAPSLIINNMSITPSNSGVYDYIVNVHWYPEGYDSIAPLRLLYSLTASPDDAFSGTFNFDFLGVNASLSSVKYKFGETWYSLSEDNFSLNDHSCSLIISLPQGKYRGTILIGIGVSDYTLPVELSNFTATQGSLNTINLQWVTQSETGLLGYYVQRGDNSSLLEAIRVSPLIAATNTSVMQLYSFSDSEISQPGTYYYWLQALDLDGVENCFGPTSAYYTGYGLPDVPEPPLTTSITSIYPNPFNPNTCISYQVKQAEEVLVQIYNLRGQLIRSLAEGYKLAGSYKIVWDGLSQNGTDCASGLYWVMLKAGQQSYMRKVILAK